MIKSSILDFRIYQNTLRNTVRSKWTSLLILFPLVLFIIYRMFENEIVAAVVAFAPLESDKSAAFYQDLLWLLFTEMLWITAFFALAWAFVLYSPLFTFARQLDRHLCQQRSGYASLIVTISFIASLLFSFYMLRDFPNSSDEYMYLFQAATMAQGKLWEIAHDLPDFFFFNNMAEKDGIILGRFPPGWPLFLSVAYWINFPVYLVNPLLAACVLFLFYRFARKMEGESSAIWSLVALALSAFFIFNGASYFSHMACALLTLIFVSSYYLYEEQERSIFAVIAGLALGMISITRYYTALLIFLPFLLCMVITWRFKTLRFLLWMGVGMIPFMLFLLAYNYAVTGNAFLPVTVWSDAAEGLGFVKGHSVLQGFEHIVRRLAMFCYWMSPGILILYAVFLVRKMVDRTQVFTRPEDYLFLSLVIGYFFYHEIGGNQYGPRFYFEALPFVILFVMRSVLQMKEKWTLAFVVVGLIYGVVKIPFIASRESTVIEERKDIYEQVNRNRIHNAVVFVSSGTGVIRPMPPGDLTRNDIYYESDVLYAIDKQEKNSLLMDYYPNRAFYRYTREPGKVNGQLERIR